MSGVLVVLPDERRTPDKTEVQVVDLGSVKAARMTLQPGWGWSECIKPIAGTESCQTHHVGTVASGQLQVRHDDDTEVQVGPGDAYVIEPGHDAWVIGSEPFVAYEFDSRPRRRTAGLNAGPAELTLTQNCGICSSPNGPRLPTEWQNNRHRHARPAGRASQSRTYVRIP